MGEVSYINLTHTAAADYPTGELSSAVWVILFSFIIILSSCANTLFCAGLVCSRKITKVYLFLLFCFLINIVEYVLLVIELPGPHYPYSDLACTLYQLLLHIIPVFSSWVLVLLISSHVLFIPIFTTIIIIICTPIILYSCLATNPSGDRYCVIDLVTVAAWVGIKQQVVTSIFFIIIKSILSFFVPILFLMTSMAKLKNNVHITLEDKTNSTLVRTIIISYGVFYLPYFSAVFIRHLLVIFSYSLNNRDSWLLDIFQSLFHLISYFFHVFRPMVCMVLDMDILTAFYRSSYRLMINRENRSYMEEK